GSSSGRGWLRPVTPADPGPLWGLLAAPTGRPAWERIGRSEGKGGNLSGLETGTPLVGGRGAWEAVNFHTASPNPSDPTGLKGLFLVSDARGDQDLDGPY